MKVKCDHCSKFSNLSNWKEEAFHLQPQYKYELFHIYFTWFHYTGRYELNKLTLLPMCGFIAQLVEHRTGITEVMGSNPVEALIFFQASSFQLLKLENLLLWSHFTFTVYVKHMTARRLCYCPGHSSYSTLGTWVFLPVQWWCGA